MSQFKNLSSWAGENGAPKADFCFDVSPERYELIQNLVSQAFKGAHILHVKSLRDYDKSKNTALFRNSLQGIYLLGIEHANLPKQILIHIKPRSSEDIIHFGAKVFDHLRQDHGLDTTEYFITDNGSYHAHADGYDCYFTDYEDGSHPQFNVDILERLGETMARLEHGLSTIPEEMKQISYSNSKHRYERWKAGLKLLQNGQSSYAKAHPNAQDLFERSRCFFERTPLTIKDGCLNHGDLIDANVLWLKDKQKIKILDCDSLHASWFPSNYDLGNLVIRGPFSQMQNTDILNIQSDVIRPILCGYNSHSNKSLTETKFARAILTVAALSMLAIAAREASEDMSQAQIEELEQHTHKIAPLITFAFNVYESIS